MSFPSERLRIAVVFEYPTLNGGEYSMLGVIEQAAENNVEAIALAPPEGWLAEALCRLEVPHVLLCLRDEHQTRLPAAEARNTLLRAIKSCSPHLVHANSLSMGRLTGALASEMGVRSIAHLRDIVKLSKAAAADLNRNHLLLAVSQATRQFHIAQGIREDRIRVLYNGVDCQRFHPRRASGNLKRELGLPPNAFLVATIGQIGLRKGQDVLAEAAVRSAHMLTDTHFLLIGERNSTKPESIRFEENVIRRFHQAGLGDKLHCLGYREDVDQLLNEIDLLVHPAHQEPLGRVLLEAAAAGVPIIATDVGGTREILSNGESARLVPTNNPQALAEAMIELHGDVEKRHRFAAKARTRIGSEFNLNRASRNLLAIWREVANAHRANLGRVCK